MLALILKAYLIVKILELCAGGAFVLAIILFFIWMNRKQK